MSCMRYLIFIVIVIAAVVFLHTQFPYVLSDADNVMHLVYSLIVVFFIGISIVASQRRLSQTLKDVALWLTIFMLGVLGYSYRDTILDSRLMAELMPSRPIMRADGTIVVRAGDNGHFFLDADVNGVRVKFMIDTGASDIVLSPEDAKRLGCLIENLDFNRSYNTANGMVRGAEVTLESLSIGDFNEQNIMASVNGASMDGSLLGMTFLQLFKEYRVEDGNLILTPSL
jgi:aspartyl protease family protein